MNAVAIVAPSDAQLRYIAGLCEERGLPFPPAVHSKAEASALIAAILDRSYDPADFEPARVPHECQRCGSDTWTDVDYSGCSDCREPAEPVPFR